MTLEDLLDMPFDRLYHHLSRLCQLYEFDEDAVELAFASIP